VCERVHGIGARDIGQRDVYRVAIRIEKRELGEAHLGPGRATPDRIHRRAPTRALADGIVQFENPSARGSVLPLLGKAGALASEPIAPARNSDRLPRASQPPLCMSLLPSLLSEWDRLETSAWLTTGGAEHGALTHARG
jgi:hypothetical protein